MVFAVTADVRELGRRQARGEDIAPPPPWRRPEEATRRFGPQSHMVEGFLVRLAALTPSQGKTADATFRRQFEAWDDAGCWDEEEADQISRRWDDAWRVAARAAESVWVTTGARADDAYPDYYVLKEAIESVRRSIPPMVRDECWPAPAENACLALLGRPLVGVEFEDPDPGAGGYYGPFTFTREQYDVLTFPLRVAGVVVHPDDAVVGS